MGITKKTLKQVDNFEDEIFNALGDIGKGLDTLEALDDLDKLIPANEYKGGRHAREHKYQIDLIQDRLEILIGKTKDAWEEFFDLTKTIQALGYNIRYNAPQAS